MKHLNGTEKKNTLALMLNTVGGNPKPPNNSKEGENMERIKPPTKTITIGVRLQEELYNEVVNISPNGNISALVKELLQKEVEKHKKPST